MPYVILLCLLALGGGYAYHSVTVSNLETQVVQLEANNRTLKENQVQMEIAVRTAQESLRAAEENAKKSEAAMSALTAKNNELAKDKANYMKIFKDHNLTRLARAKPGMIEKRINNGTEKVFRMLEDDTKELMDADDNDPATSGLPVDATTGVGIGGDSDPTRTTDSDSDGESPSADLSTAAASGD